MARAYGNRLRDRYGLTDEQIRLVDEMQTELQNEQNKKRQEERDKITQQDRIRQQMEQQQLFNETSQKYREQMQRDLAPDPQVDSQRSNSTNSNDGFMDTLLGIPMGWAKERGQSLKTGFQALNPFDDVSSEEAWKNFEQSREEEANSSYRRLSDSMLRGATAGFLHDENVDNSGGLGVTGQIAGSILPGGLIAKGLRGTRFGANIGKNATFGQRAYQTGKEGFNAGAIYGTAEGFGNAVNDENKRNVGDILQTAGLNALGGAFVDPALSELFRFAGRGAGQVLNNVGGSQSSPTPTQSSTPQARTHYRPEDIARLGQSQQSPNLTPNSQNVGNLDQFTGMNAPRQAQQQMDALQGEGFSARQGELLGLPSPQPTQRGIPARRTQVDNEFKSALDEFNTLFNQSRNQNVPYQMENLDRYWNSYRQQRFPNMADISLDEAIKRANGQQRLSSDQLSRLRTRLASGQALDFQPQQLDPQPQVMADAQAPTQRGQLQPRQPVQERQRQQIDLLQQLQLAQQQPQAQGLNVGRTPQQPTSLGSTPQATSPQAQAQQQVASTTSGGGQGQSQPKGLMNASEKPRTENQIERIESKWKKRSEKFVESYLNKNRQFSLADQRTTEKRLKELQGKGNLDTAEKEELAQLKVRQKQIKADESEVEKAVANEEASLKRATAMIDMYFPRLEQVLGGEIQMKDALEYQISRDLLWRLNNGGLDQNYKLPKGYDWNKIQDIVAQGQQNPRLQRFSQVNRQMNEDILGTMRKYDLIAQDEYEKLLQNPEYLPLHRDGTWRTDNIDLGSTYQQGARRSTDPRNLFHMQDGTEYDYFKNPLESIVNNIFSINQMALRNDTAQQLAKLADMGSDEVKWITRDEFLDSKGGGLEVRIDGETRYIKPQEDLIEILNENDLFTNDVVSSVTSFISGLKTRSLEYQLGTSLLRDIPTSYLNTTGRGSELAKAVWTTISGRNRRSLRQQDKLMQEWMQPNTSPQRQDEIMNEIKQLEQDSIDLTRLGATYGKQGYQGASYGQNPEKVREEYVKDLNGISGERAKTKAKKIGNMISDIFFMGGRQAGNFLDTLPREIEAQVSKQRFDKFVKPLQKEVDELQSKWANETDPLEKETLLNTYRMKEAELNQKLRDMERDTTFKAIDIMPYGRTGRGGFSKGIRQAVMFANTATQSKYRLARSFRRNPARTTARALTVTAPLIAGHHYWWATASDEDRENYRNLPQYIKDFSYTFINGDDVVTVPKVQELAIMQNFLESAYTGEGWNETSELAMRELFPYQLGQAFSGSIANMTDGDESTTIREGLRMPSTPITPLVDVATNTKSSFNKKPVSYDPNNADPYTSQSISNLFGQSETADSAEYLLRQYGGDVAKYGIEGLDTALGNQEPQELMRTLNFAQDRYMTDDSPVFREAYYEEDGNIRGKYGLGSEASQRFKEELSQLTQERNQARDNVRESIRQQYPNLSSQEVNQLVGDTVQFDQEQQYQMYQEIADSLEPILYQMESVQSSNLSDQEKQRQLKQLKQQEQSITNSIRQILGWER